MQTIALTFVVLLLFNSVFVRSQTTTCAAAFECTDQSLSDDRVEGQGYKSITGSLSTIDTTQNVLCGGSFGCNGISYINAGWNIFCSGDNSCSNIISTDSLDALNVDCQGASSCVGNKIASSAAPSNSVECFGGQSCMDTEIYTSSLRGWGPYSLMNSEIYSIDDSTFSTILIDFVGYHAGYNAHVICLAGHSCSIGCRGNACYNTQVTCLGSCTISCEINDGIHCPNNVSLGASTTIASAVVDIDANTIGKDVLCNAINAVNYDDYITPFGFYSGLDLISNVGGGYLCCRATDACRFANTVKAIDVDNDVICSGYAACSNVDLASTPCEGDKQGGLVSQQGNVICSGSVACQRSTISAEKDIFCDGFGSCAWTTMFNTDSVYCLGYITCIGSTYIL